MDSWNQLGTRATTPRKAMMTQPNKDRVRFYTRPPTEGKSDEVVLYNQDPGPQTADVSSSQT